MEGRRKVAPPPPPQRGPQVRLLGVAWPRYGIGTMPADEEVLYPDGKDFVVKPGAMFCRGRTRWTCILPRMRQPILPAFLATKAND